MTELDYEEKRKELIGKVKDHKKEAEAEQQAALEAIAQGGDLERYATVELGELEIEVKAWIPGEVEETIQQAQAIAESGDEADISKSMETMITALEEMTVSDTFNRHFWRQYYSKWGSAGMVVGVETILTPAMEEIEDMEDGIKSFRPETRGSPPRTRMRDAKSKTE